MNQELYVTLLTESLSPLEVYSAYLPLQTSNDSAIAMDTSKSQGVFIEGGIGIKIDV